MNRLRHSPQLLLFDAGETARDRIFALAIDLFQAHIDAGVSSGRLRPRTVAEYRVSARKFAKWCSAQPKLIEWANVHRSATPMDMVGQLTRSDCDSWLDWVSRETMGSNPGRVTNKRREHLSAILSQLSLSDVLVPTVPRRRPQVSRRQKVTMTPLEIGRLYRSLARLRTPPSWDNGLGPFSAYWQAALVFFVVLGVDTGAIWPADLSDPTALRWRCWYKLPSPPTRNTDHQNSDGWLIYSRGKTSYPMQRPVNSVMAWQLKRLAKLNPKAKPDDLIWPAWKWSRGWRPTEIFRRACRDAGITPAVDARTLRPVPWLLLHLRKTSSTWHNTATPGSGSAVLGHRSTELASVTESHYVDCNPLAERAILSTPWPAEFPRSS